LPGFTAPFTSEQGYTDFFTPASPAAGANFSIQVGDFSVTWLRIVAVKATLATDANAANRLFSLDFKSGRAGTMIRNAATVLITANTSATVFQWDRAHAVSEWQTGTPVFVPLVDIVLSQGWTIQLTVDNIQATDAITAISFVVEKYYPDS
jgi:hypothetical protein